MQSQPNTNGNPVARSLTIDLDEPASGAATDSSRPCRMNRGRDSAWDAVALGRQFGAGGEKLFLFFCRDFVQQPQDRSGKCWSLTIDTEYQDNEKSCRHSNKSHQRQNPRCADCLEHFKISETLKNKHHEHNIEHYTQYKNSTNNKASMLFALNIALYPFGKLPV